MSWKIALGAALAFVCHLGNAAAVVLYEDRVVEVAQTLADPTDLWIDPAELERVNGFVLKPEGACIDDICVPVRQSENSDIFFTRQGQRWFNVAELADRVQQPYVVDHDAGVWSFGAIPAQRSGFVDRAVAPDFALPDVSGKIHKLSDFKGKKIMLLSWASW
ncbi:MAG: redoxin domain-containing protein [Gammaproteobacteria bacterium]|nr:redoxin domain-containing protein [Gammaproteobacteria bacterium]